MSKSESHANSKDLFSVYQQNVDKLLEGVSQSVPQYHQSITNVQQEYLQAFENIVKSGISLQREFAKKAGVTTNIPDAVLKVIQETVEEVSKSNSIQNQIALATIDAMQQNIKTINDNAKSFAEINRNIIESWISALTPRT